MEKLSFNVDANTARLIGRENVSKLDGAIIELVKNSYDADATFCVLYYENSSKTFWLIDDGVGMSEDVIKRHWMSIGFSDKDVVLRSKTGRIKTGAKGIGRFALDRLGSDCKMYTKNEEDSIVWSVNWEDFVRGKNIDQIYAVIEHRDFIAENAFDTIKNDACRQFVCDKFVHGTAFKIEQLRDEWDQGLIDKLVANLSSLIPPSIFENFKVYFFCEDTPEEDALICSSLLSAFDYSIEFNVHKNGKADLLIQRNEFDFGSKFDYIIREADFTKNDAKYFNGEKIKKQIDLAELNVGIDEEHPYELGNFFGRIYFYKIVKQEKNAIKFYYKPFESRKNIIKQYGGIKIYRDGFRVRPYGEADTPQFDWLLMSVRHYKSAFAISSNTGPWTADASQLIGEINISRTNNKLNDQANREGIFEDSYFEQFKDIVTNIISYMEEDRQYVCRKLNKLWEKENAAKALEEDINKKYDEYIKTRSNGSAKDENQTVNNAEYIHISDAIKLIESKDSELQELEDENKLLRSLATTGIAINTYMHETKTLIHTLKMFAKRASEAYRLRRDVNETVEYVDKVRDATKYFESWFQVTIDSVKSDKRKRQKVNLPDLVSQCITSWQKALRGDIKINLECAENDIYLDCFPYEIESIVHNLISNSYKSFKRSSMTEKIIQFNIFTQDDKLHISYSDNGNGLVAKFKKNPDVILRQMITSDVENGKVVGTGMGLWIVNSIVNEYRGKIDLSKNITASNGFYMDIIL